jgi:hypothetical protein
MLCSGTMCKGLLGGGVESFNCIPLHYIACILPLSWEQHLSHNSPADDDCDKSATLSMEIKESSCILPTAKYYPNWNNTPSMYLITNISNHQVTQSKRASRKIVWFCPAPQLLGIHVKGTGVLADLYHIVASAFQPLGVKMTVDNAACLPKPIPPDIGCYLQIGTVKLSLYNKKQVL